jgi:glycogen operon protein
LRDLVSYDSKHNEANGENNQDGCNDNDSWNMGVEGEADDPAIRRERQKQMRNFLATLMLSQGVPMLSMGDEIGKTQNGNNNAYCQDNEISWMHWDIKDDHRRLLDFTSRLIELRKSHPNFRRKKFYQDRTIRKSVVRDIVWYGADGHEMTEEEWGNSWIRSLGLMFNGETLNVIDEVMGRPVVDDTFLILINSYHEGVEFAIPKSPHQRGWISVLDTANDEDPFKEDAIAESRILTGRSLMLLKELTAD